MNNKNLYQKIDLVIRLLGAAVLGILSPLLLLLLIGIGSGDPSGATTSFIAFSVVGTVFVLLLLICISPDKIAAKLPGTTVWKILFRIIGYAIGMAGPIALLYQIYYVNFKFR